MEQSRPPTKVRKMEKKENPWIEANKKVRRTWGEIRPVTRLIPNKKKAQSDKHKKDYRREER